MGYWSEEDRPPTLPAQRTLQQLMGSQCYRGFIHSESFTVMNIGRLTS